MNSCSSTTFIAFHNHASVPLNHYSCLPKKGSLIDKRNFAPKHSQQQKQQLHQQLIFSRNYRKQHNTFRYLTAFDKESNDDRPSDDVKNSDFNRDEEDHHHNHDFLNFDDEALLEELMELSDDFDVDSNLNLINLDDELEELERLIGEQTGENKTSLILPNDEKDSTIEKEKIQMITPESTPKSVTSSSALEEALLQGVVPAEAGVGSNCLPGDYGFDPLGISTKDYFKQAQNFFLGLLPSKENSESESESKENTTNNYESSDSQGAALPLYTKPMAPLYNDSERPPALILRDYREAEIRHGRLAMLAAILWPLQEIIDRLFIPESFGRTTFVYGGVTLPFISLFMTLTMLLLGYLDIYAASIKDNESGDAFLPGECFWDPLSMLDGAPDSMKRKMQERELNNGRMAMVAVLSYIIQEAITHQPVISLPWNQVLFEPAFEIPEVQAWLDAQFAGGTVQSIGVDNFDLPVDETNIIMDGIEDFNIGDIDKTSFTDTIDDM